MASCPREFTSGPPPTYDVAQEREFYKYYQPLHLGLANRDPVTHAGPPQARASPDRTLTAFAQLGTLRLNCRRSYISFFDRDYQYLLAEATRTLSLQTDSVHAAGDGLDYGVSIVPKSGSICEHSLSLPSEQDETKIDNAVLIIPDLREDDRFNTKAYTVEKNWRFYAGAPIVSPGGYKIGTYCVIDDQPRDGLSPDDVAFLKDMATVSMVHLDMLRAQSESYKGARMVRGLGSFVDGKSSLDDWWMRSNNDERDFPSGPDQTWAERQYSRHHDTKPNSDLTSLSSSVKGFGIHLDAGTQVKQNTPAPLKQATKPMDENPKVKKTSQMDTLPTEVKSTFGRASSIIREALNIDACVIFDATAHSTFGGLIDQETHERPKRRKVSSASEDSDANSSFVDSGTGSESSNADLNETGQREKEEDKACEILGFSTPERSSVNGDQAVRVTDGMTESFLRSLLRRYPHGKVLTFDENGEVPSTDNLGQQESASGSTTPKGSTKKRKRLRNSDAKRLRQMFPGVRSLAIVPMWDSDQKFFSACVVWTVDPHRILTAQSELSYLAAFSDVIMVETARIKAKTADKAKSDFISSISHELRSPLHGILGSVECLQDSVLSGFQENLVHTMETCGKTLLDTIDHLLDFAKINNFTRKNTSTPEMHGQTQNFALDVDVDLSVVTEEVLESVFAGFDFIKAGQDAEGMSKMNKSHASRPADFKSKRDVSVVVDIKKAQDSHWIFRTQAGAWRRVLMNLFGNSLKYTERGFIQVTLGAKPLPKSMRGGESEVTLTVTDSGKGISQQYLDKSLFVPFAQEDAMQSGTGLGLAITSAIVKSMGGHIKVESEQGKGTTTTVTMKMPHAPRDQNFMEQSIISSATKKTKGLKIGFVGFDADSTKKVPKPNTRSPGNAHHLFMSSFHRMCQSWFEMDMFVTDGLDKADADVFLTTEKGLDQIQDQLQKYMTQQSDEDAQNKISKTPLLVICNSVATANAMMHAELPHISGVISQPCGPRKLAKALTLCLESFEASQDPNRDPPTVRAILDDRLGESQNAFGNVFKSSMASQKRADDADRDFKNNSKEQDERSKNNSDGEKPKGKSAGPPLRHPHEDTLQIPQGRTRVPKEDNSALEKNAQSSSDHKNVCKLLLVDDNAINLQLLVTFVKKQGHAFMTASNGLEAVEAYKAQCEESTEDRGSKMADPPFDFVVMDVSMPVMDGLEATKKIRSHERQANIKPTTVIALTGLASTDAQQEAFSSGIDTFMTKPVKMKELNRYIEDSMTNDNKNKTENR